MTTPILDLETLEPKRPMVKIDGVLYPMAILSDFGITRQAVLSRLVTDAADLETEIAKADRDNSPRANAIRQALEDARAQTKPDAELIARLEVQLRAATMVTEPEAKRLETLVDEATTMILMAPAEVVAKLSPIHKRKVIEAFRGTVPTAPTVPAKRKAQPKARTRRTSASCSRSSHGPTALPTG